MSTGLKWRPRGLTAPEAARHAHHRLRLVDGGITRDEAGIFASELRAIGFDYVCVSSGGISPQARPAAASAYQVPLADRLHRNAAAFYDRRRTRRMAIIASDQADFVALARGFLDDPR